MMTSLRLSLALLCAALVCGQAAADIAQYNPGTGQTTVSSSRPASGDLFEFEVPPANHVTTPYTPKPWGSAQEALNDPVIFSQPIGAVDAGGFYSDAVPGQFYSQRIADNFTTPAGGVDWLLTGVRWWGSSEFFLFPNYTNMDAFVVEIYADAGGVPGLSLTGPLVYSTAATNPTPIGVSFNGATVYEQDVNFPALQVPPNTNLWISIGADVFSPFDDAWVWTLAGSGDNVIAADFFSGGYTAFQGFGDVSFEIAGQRVPEPGSIALCSIGALALGYVALRRNR